MKALAFSLMLAIIIWASIINWLLIFIWGSILLMYLIISCIFNCQHKNSFHRKVQIATWNDAGDPSIFIRLEVDRTIIDTFLDKYNNSNPEKKV